MMISSAVRTLNLAAVLGVLVSAVQAAGYDPLAVPEATIQTLELIVHDAARDRDIPILVYLPTSTDPAPVVLFSHGLGGNRYGSKFLGEQWARRGYLSVFLQHPGSDDSVWKGKPAAEVMPAMNKAANGKNFLLRVKDVPAVIDQLTAWNSETGQQLHGRLDPEQIGMSGHSFGGVTTQAVSGQSFGRLGPRLTDPRIQAAIVFSPSTPRDRSGPKAAFGSVKVPWMLMTGTEDTSPIGNESVESRLSVYPALPPGDKYEVVLDQAQHSVFTDRALPGDTHQRNPNHHRVILALSTAFWDAYLRGDEGAKAWLQGDGPRGVMEPADRWERK